MLKILFWLLVAIDGLAIVVFGLLGLAAAAPSKTNPIAALVIPFLIPAAILAGAIVLFVSSQNLTARISALIIAGLPLLIVAGGAAKTFWELRSYRDATGNITQFRSQALRDIEAAIPRNDAAAVTAAARGVDLNTPGLSGASVLVLAFRQLQQTPTQLEVIKALLAAGANPNISSSELPLEIAISQTRAAGLEPVRLLLDAGANPNAVGEWGSPAFFMAGGAGISVEVIELLHSRGANLQLRNKQGETAVSVTIRTANWPVLEFLVKHGTPWQDQKGLGGVPLLAYLENEAHHSASRPGGTNRLADALALMKSQQTQPTP